MFTETLKEFDLMKLLQNIQLTFHYPLKSNLFEKIKILSLNFENNERNFRA